MKFSTRTDTQMPAADLFDALADFERSERLLLRRGVAVTRHGDENAVGLKWDLKFDWRGQARDLSLRVTRFDRPEVIGIDGMSAPFELFVTMSVVALSPTKSRLIFELEAKPRHMRARLMLQTAKIGKSALDRKFSRRIGEYVADLQQSIA